MNDYLCPKTVAALLGISPRTAYRWMSSGRIQSFRLGAKLWRCSAEDLERFVAAQRERVLVTNGPLNQSHAQ